MEKAINTENDMVFRTKFKPGDEIYFVHDNRVHKAKVHSLRTIMKKDSDEIDQTVYRVNYKTETLNTIEVPERHAFASIDDIFTKSVDFDSDNADDNCYEDERVNCFPVDYKIGDVVYFVEDNSMTDGVVKNIELSFCTCCDKPTVTLHIVSVLRKEDYKINTTNAFKSKEELLDNLRKTYIDLSTIY